MFAPTRLIRGLAALASCALCSCSNDDTGASSEVVLNDAGKPIPGGSFTLSGALTGTGGNCSAEGGEYGGGLNDIVRIIIECTDGPEPLLDLAINMPSPPAVGTNDLSKTLPAYDAFQYDDPAAPVDLGKSTQVQSLTVKLTAVTDLPTGVGFAAHGTATGTFSLTSSTTVDVTVVF